MYSAFRPLSRPIWNFVACHASKTFLMFGTQLGLAEYIKSVAIFIFQCPRKERPAEHIRNVVGGGGVRPNNCKYSIYQNNRAASDSRKAKKLDRKRTHSYELLPLIAQHHLFPALAVFVS